MWPALVRPAMERDDPTTIQSRRGFHGGFAEMEHGDIPRVRLARFARDVKSMSHFGSISRVRRAQKPRR